MGLSERVNVITVNFTEMVALFAVSNLKPNYWVQSKINSHVGPPEPLLATV